MATSDETTATDEPVYVNQRLAQEHGVRGVPTLKLYSDGEQVEGIVGVRSEDQFRELIRRYEA